MPDETPSIPSVRVFCPRCGRSEIAPEGDPEPWLPKIAEAGPFMQVAHTTIDDQEHVGIYCRTCWKDVLASFVKGILAPTQREPVDAANAGPAANNNEAVEATN